MFDNIYSCYIESYNETAVLCPFTDAPSVDFVICWEKGIWLKFEPKNHTFSEGRIF